MQRTRRTDLLTAIHRLCTAPDDADDGGPARPTPYAVAWGCRLLALCPQDMPPGHVSVDACAGLRIEWRLPTGAELRLVVHPADAREHYLFCEQDNYYEAHKPIHKPITPIEVRAWMVSLMGHGGAELCG